MLNRVVGLTALAIVAAAAVPAGAVGASAQRVIVLGGRARERAPIAARLRSEGARAVHSYALVDAVSATVTPGQEAQLKSDPSVAEVVPDETFKAAPIPGPDHAARVNEQLCPKPGRTQLEPQAIETIRAASDAPHALTARSLGFDGAGVKVAYIADGSNTDSRDFVRANGAHVFSDYEDFSGEGPAGAVAGGEGDLDASSIAAQGRVSHDIAGFSVPRIDRPCLIRVEGAAPGASLVGLKAFNQFGSTTLSTFLQAIDYAVSVAHVQVLNESFGSTPYPDDEGALDLLKSANDAAVAAGTTVTVASGDSGVRSTIGSPASDPNVLAVGATTTYRSAFQVGCCGSYLPGVKGWLDDNISMLSSGGFEQDGRTLDLVAPGDLNWYVCTTDCADSADDPSGVTLGGGTSESAPLAAGVAALVIQAYRHTHGGASPSPALVKRILTSTADDIHAPADQQGAGLLDAYRAVRAAESAPGGHLAGDALLAKSGQLNATGATGSRQTLTDTITNDGQSTQTISVDSRTLGAYRTVKTARVVMADSNPQVTVNPGFTVNSQTVTFDVPPGQERLDTAIAYKGPGAFDDPNLAGLLRMTLVDPAGRVAATGDAGGDSNYEDLQVTNPSAGRWTAYVLGQHSSDGGTTGPVAFSAGVARYEPFGRVTPSRVTLAPGRSADIRLSVALPGQPGDQAGELVLTAGHGPDATTTTIPVTLRSLVTPGHQSFGGTATGGDAFSPVTGPAAYYQLDLPAGRPELNATVTVADPDVPFDAWLVSPSGEALAHSANAFPNADFSGLINEPGATLHVIAPEAGRWTLVIAFLPQASGNSVAEAFTVVTDQDPIHVAAPGLPDSASVKLPAGQPYSFDLTIHNGGPGSEEYFTDARLPATTQLQLAPLRSATTTVPFRGGAPRYLVPTHTTVLSAAASTSGSQPIDFAASFSTGDPQIQSSAGLTPTASLAAPSIAQGLWFIVPAEVGPFGASGAPTEPVTASMTATTEAFDPSFDSSEPDCWEAATDPALLAPCAPDFFAAGQDATIHVTITPTTSPGTTVSGTLYIDDVSLVFAQIPNQIMGDEIVALPYTYTVSSPAG